MKEVSALKKLLLMLLLIVLLPALFYSGYEVSTISTTEELIASIYRRQLDVILFSLNQYALDVANNWVSATTLLLNERHATDPDSLKRMAEKFLDKNSSIYAVVLSDTLVQSSRLYRRALQDTTLSINDSSIIRSIQAKRETIARLLRYQKIDYRKIEPVQIGNNGDSQTLALLAVATGADGAPIVVTYVLHEQVFINRTLAAKLQDAAGEEFVLAVFKRGELLPVYATTPEQAGGLKQQKQLWLFPNYSLGIGLKGTTIEELSQTRFTRTMLLIIIVDVVLLIGVWVVYRNIRRQIEFVRLKADFVSNVSHELRTPLALIRMFAETLEMGRVKNEEKRQEYYTTILQETERLTRLINRILDFSRMEAGKKEYQFQPVQINEIIGQILDTYTAHFQSKGIEPVLKLQEGLPALYADRETLTEACMNIVDNALKYSGDEKYLRIETGLQGDFIFIEIEDHGIGIAQEHHKKIFENFFRVSGALVHNVKGSGLGLALVKHIVDAHKGTITLKSALGKGSAFRLQFPVNQQSHDNG